MVEPALSKSRLSFVVKLHGFLGQLQAVGETRPLVSGFGGLRYWTGLGRRNVGHLHLGGGSLTEDVTVVNVLAVVTEPAAPLAVVPADAFTLYLSLLTYGNGHFDMPLQY